MNGIMTSQIVKEISESRMSKEEKEERRVKLEKVSEADLQESDKEEMRKKILAKYVMSNVQIGKLRTEVKIVMWKYYSENKSIFPDYIGDFREEIIVELMKGKSVETVFDSYRGGGELLKTG
ncbi:hypothetical protein ACFL3W_00040 [Pseudomonadota bacterium]